MGQTKDNGDSHTSSVERSPLSPWRRLSVRLGALVAVGTLTCFYLEAQLHRAALRWLDNDVYVHGAVWASDEDFARLDPDVATAISVLDPERAESSARIATALADWSYADDCHFVVLNSDGTIASSDLQTYFPRGEPFVPSAELAGLLDWFFVPPAIDSVESGSRWLCLLPSSGPFDYLPGGASAAPRGDETILEGGVLVISEERANELEAQYERTAHMVRWGLSGGFAVLLGLLASWWITLRIRHIGEFAASSPADDSAGSRIGGDDEIAALATELARSRGRVTQLIRDAEERDVQRREWVAQVSHDLRTPLTALGACLERAQPLVRLLPTSDTRAALASTIDVAQRDATRVNRIAEDLLDAARLELPNAIQSEEILMVEVAERAVELLQPLAQREGKTLSLHFEGQCSMVSGDGHRLLRVLENLVRNGIEHASSSVIVRVTAERLGVRTTVIDDGPGLHAPPTAAPSDRKRQSHSSGLGLVVVRRTLAAHGAKLMSTDESQGGAAMGFLLPWHSSAPTTPPPERIPGE